MPWDSGIFGGKDAGLVASNARICVRQLSREVSGGEGTHHVSQMIGSWKVTLWSMRDAQPTPSNSIFRENNISSISNNFRHRYSKR